MHRDEGIQSGICAAKLRDGLKQQKHTMGAKTNHSLMPLWLAVRCFCFVHQDFKTNIKQNFLK